MKSKLFTILLAIILCTSIFTGVYAVKPSWNLASAQTIAWNLSADVMPVPPYGSRDIPGSDTASKLIINQPNGAVEVSLTGVMKGLTPNTLYQVYLSKGYTPYPGWNVVGTWQLRFIYGGNYDHDMWITVQEDGTFTGTGAYPADATTYSTTWTVSGTIVPKTGAITLHIEYDGSSYEVDAVGTIDLTGAMSGTWESNIGQLGNWLSISGAATRIGSTGWSGYFTSEIPYFTFTTDENGEGSWHINLKDDIFPEDGLYDLSIWVNVPGATILISDTFTVEV